MSGRKLEREGGRKEGQIREKRIPRKENQDNKREKEEVGSGGKTR